MLNMCFSDNNMYFRCALNNNNKNDSNYWSSLQNALFLSNNDPRRKNVF